MDTIHTIDATRALLNDSDFYYMISVDTDGNYSYINTKYSQAFGFVSNTLIGQPYHITMHPDDTNICAEVGGKCYEQPGKLFPAIIRKHNGSGGYVITQWEFTLMVENGFPTGIFCIGFDITEYVRVNTLNKRINLDLEQKKNLLFKIAFEQSHIVRAPLANIIGLVNILKNLKLGPNAESIISMLDESSRQLDDVITSTVAEIH